MFKKLWDESDKRLIELCLKGHAPAWDCLVQRYKRLVYHFPSQARLQSEDCDEIFQETFMVLCKDLEKLGEVENLGAWIGTVAQRATWKLMHRRRKSLDEELPENYEFADPSQLPERDVEIKLAQAKIRNAIMQLKENCQKLLSVLFYQQDSENYDLIAKETGIPRGSIGPTRQRCLAKLKDELEKMGITQKSVSKWFP